MPFPQLRHPVNDQVQNTDATTQPFDLPNSGKLHAVFLKIKATNGATSCRNKSLFDAITLVEIVGDGSDVLFSLTPQEIEKRYELYFGKPLEQQWDERGGNVQTLLLPILFGRGFYDPEMWLPLGAYKVVTMRITYSTPISATAGFATGTTTFDVVLLITPDDVSLSYKGTLCTKRIKDFQSASSGDDFIDLPIRNKIRDIAVYAYKNAQEDQAIITRVLLEGNDGAYKLADLDWENAQDVSRLRYRARIVHDVVVFATDGATIDTRLGKIKAWSAELLTTQNSPATHVYFAGVKTISGDRLTITQIDVTETATDVVAADASGKPLFLSVEGVSPSYYVHIPLDPVDDPDHYLDSAQYSKLRLTNTQGVSGATIRYSITELRQLTR